MTRTEGRRGIVGWSLGLFTVLSLTTDPVAAQTPALCSPQSEACPWPANNGGHSPCGGPRSGSIDLMQQLTRMSPEQLDCLYEQAAVGAIPNGKTRGRTLFRPGTSLAPSLSRASRAVW